VNISAAAVISNYAGFSIYGASEVGARRRVGTLGRVDAARFAVMRFGGDRTAENEKTGIEKLKTWLSALEDCGKRRTHLPHTMTRRGRPSSCAWR